MEAWMVADCIVSSTYSHSSSDNYRRSSLCSLWSTFRRSDTLTYLSSSKLSLKTTRFKLWWALQTHTRKLLWMDRSVKVTSGRTSKQDWTNARVTKQGREAWAARMEAARSERCMRPSRELDSIRLAVLTAIFSWKIAIYLSDKAEIK